MSHSTKLYLVALAAIVLSVVSYFLNNDPKSVWDELFLLLSVSVILLLIILLNIWFIRPIQQISYGAQEAIKGNIKHQIAYLGDDEIDQISYSINTMASSISRAKYFVEQIGEGKLDADFQNADRATLEKDPLAQALLAMRTQLVQINEREKERKWTAEGLALFAEILRANQKTEQELASDILTNLVRYVNGLQGALYVLSEDHENNQVLNLVAAYGLPEERLAKPQLHPGEGLTGQSLLEKQHFYLDNLPEGYTKVESGLGESVPRFLLVMPLKANENVYGVVEIASMSAMPPYVIEFVRRVSENIAATIATVTANTKNLRLLEESQAMTEQLRAQEEEMRQNMEELMATQEEMARKQIELERSREQLQKAKEELEENERQIRQVVQDQKGMIVQLETQKKKLEANESILKKAYEKMRQNQMEVDKKKAELEEANKQMTLQKAKIEANEVILKKSYEKMQAQQREFKIKQTELILQKTINKALIATLAGFYYACEATNDYKAILIEGDPQLLTGYSSEQFLSGQVSLSAIIHPDYKAHVDAQVQQGIDRQDFYTIIYDVLKADGTIVKVWEKGFPIYENDELSHFIGFIIDYDLAHRLKLDMS
ncbi:GAF domain-containing protein [Rhodoflexus sp.]